MSSVVETEEHKALRAAVAALGQRYGRDYLARVAREGGHPDELWADAAKLGYLGVNLPEEYGGGGGGIAELSIVLEELGAAGCPLLMMVVSPAICGTVISRFGTEAQKQAWLPGLADGSRTMAFGITEPDAGSNSHRITTTARREGDEWVLTGRKVFISGVDIADATLIVGRTEDARTGSLKPCLFIVPRDTPASPAPSSRWNSRRRRSSSNWSWTRCGCPPNPSSATRTPACSSSSPGSTPSAS